MLTKILEIWTGIMNWFTTSATSISSLFYANDTLTIFGVLAIIGVGISIVLLLVNLVKDFLQLR